MDYLNEAILHVIEDHQRQINAKVEEACERALQGGKYGVLVIERYGDGGTEIIKTEYSVGVHPAVPYGQIYWVPPWLSSEEIVEKLNGQC